MNTLDEYQTIELLKDGYSLARFGDGEFFNIIQNKKSISGMQEYNDDLRSKLINIFETPIDNLLIGIPRMRKPKPWVSNFTKEFSEYIKDKPSNNKYKFVSAFISRPSIVNNDNNEYFEELKDMWYERDIVIVNFNEDIIYSDLFDMKFTRFIKINRQNCFSDYDNILNKCKEHFNEAALFLISAGPTASCLAYDICSNNEQAIDIGQLIFEYNLYKKETYLEKWTSQNSYRKDKYK